MAAEAGPPVTPSLSDNVVSGKEVQATQVPQHQWEYKLRKYLLLLATLVATMTYGAAFNPPGGVWQNADPALDRIAGDPIIRDTSHRRYLVYFYSNATAFASSLVLTVLILILSVLHDKWGKRRLPLKPLFAMLRFVMVMDLVSLVGAYAAATFRDRLTVIYSLILLAGAVVYLVVRYRQSGSMLTDDHEGTRLRLRKVLILLATFAASVTYVAGLSAPGGFWDHAEGGHNPGDAVLKGGHHDARLKTFFLCNTTAFVASLVILVMLLEEKLCFGEKVRDLERYGFIAVTLLGLVAAYVAGSCRETDTTIYVSSLVCAVVVCILAQVGIALLLGQESSSDEPYEQPTQALEKSRSLVLLLATLAAAITYQAGLNPPGGLWQSDDIGGRHMAGDPILLTANPRRYKAFYYCNSVAFVASLVAIILVRTTSLHHHNALVAAMILDLFGLIGAYA